MNFALDEPISIASFLVPPTLLAGNMDALLKNKTFAENVIFQNSGTEATEAAIKVARRYFYVKGKPKKK